MKVFKAIVAVVVVSILFGCAGMKPHEGMSIKDLNQLSGLTLHGNLALVAQQGGYEVYQSTGSGEKPFYIVKYGTLVKIASNGAEAQEYINEQNEMNSLRFANEADYKFGKSIGVDGLELQQLRKHGISDSAGFKQLKAEFESNQSIYGSRVAVDSMLQYLQDKATATSKNQTVAQVVQDRKAEEEKSARLTAEDTARERARADRQRAEAEVEAARQRVQRAKEYPFEAVLSCGGMSGSQTALCFVGEHDVNTELELTNGKEYHMWQAFNVNNLVREILAQQTEDTREGLVIPLRKHFSLKVQNASKNLLLSVVIRDVKTHEVKFQKSAAKFGIISVSN